MTSGDGKPTARIEACDVWKRKRIIHEGHAVEVEVLKEISFAVQRGEIYTIIGPSGSGKSTLLRLLNRLEEPSQGVILLDGRPLSAYEVTELRCRVSLVFQTPVMFEGTVKENLLIPLRLRHGSKAHRSDDELEQLLEQAGLSGSFLHRLVNQLSVGQQQRVSIARALVHRPEVLLLDEPTSALDPTASQRLLETVAELSRRMGLTVVLVTHTVDHARLIGDRTMLLVDGRMIEEQPTAAFFANPHTEISRQFLAGELINDS